MDPVTWERKSEQAQDGKAGERLCKECQDRVERESWPSR